MSKLNKPSIVLVIALWLVVLIVGLACRLPMIGDEVTHYYMLVTQSERLPTPSFEIHIPVGVDGSETEVRNYPHTFLWHYIGAILFRLTGSSAVIQLYQSLFLLQLLVVVMCIMKDLGYGRESEVSALAAIVSLPMTLLFSVVFYQDVPAVAQALTALYFLMSRKWLAGAIFMTLALCIKEPMFLFLPAYLVILIAVDWKLDGRLKKCAIILISAIIMFSACYGVARAIRQHGNASYYPADMIKVTINRILVYLPEFFKKTVPGSTAVQARQPGPPLVLSFCDPKIIANNPGDLRNPVNWLMYGGGVFYLLLIFGSIGWLCRGEGRSTAGDSRVWWFSLAGVSYLILAYLFLGAPEARFFMPGLIMIAITLAVGFARLPGARIWVAVLSVVAIAQTGAVLAKTYTLRHVPSGITEAIDFLRRDPPKPNRVFMYPEGNYRLFPCPHEWYLLPEYELRTLWKGNNDQRIALLRKHVVGAIVIKKHLIGKIDQGMENLGIYPDYFVKDIECDSRFRKVLDNKDILIYLMPDQGR